MDIREIRKSEDCIFNQFQFFFRKRRLLGFHYLDDNSTGKYHVGSTKAKDFTYLTKSIFQTISTLS